MAALYRVYLRNFDGAVDASSKTATSDRGAAEAAFASLVDRESLDGQKLAAVLSLNNQHLAFHRFDRSPGDNDYWRGRLDDIAWPRGRPAEMESGGRTNVYLDADSLERAKKIGGGNVSLGIRLALEAADSGTSE